jgi:hypothetical protein
MVLLAIPGLAVSALINNFSFAWCSGLFLEKERGRDARRGANVPLRRPVSLASFKGDGEETLERGFAPSLPTLPLPLLREGGQGDRFLNSFRYSPWISNNARI